MMMRLITPTHQRVPGVCCAHAYIMPVVNTFILNKFKWTIKRETR